MIPNIKKELVVNAAQQTCFEAFTQKMDTWWPRTHHVGKCPMTEMVLEAGQGGRWYSKHEDGSEVNVGIILAWNPYDLLLLNWQIDANFQYDPSITTEVEVKFIAEGDRTRVFMEHKDLERLGEGGKAIDSMDEGWGMILNLYKNVVEQ
ncbi:SRPBCC family protein [Mucilaginibacter sabulilitoris]|uniref:SRPBCC family protein n=1 Tax=Mucilaginibacter sabulilitoris TaxID=1173583 RepID=A0ABZ0TFL3_9SPHI|nr:SRPBCC family protein [Mucilaginibacter sabulilitoris]WPU91554.1 SRPBCC family protein [Mucilaginibacter sabulilitoris]